MTAIPLPMRYVLVSGTCVVIHNLVMIVGDAAGLSLALCVMLSFCIVALTGYVLHSAFTFREPLQASRFAKYAVGMSLNIPLAYVAIWFWHEVVSLEMILASPVATVCMIGVNFGLSRWAILPRSSYTG